MTIIILRNGSLTQNREDFLKKKQQENIEIIPEVSAEFGDAGDRFLISSDMVISLFSRKAKVRENLSFFVAMSHMTLSEISKICPFVVFKGR